MAAYSTPKYLPQAGQWTEALPGAPPEIRCHSAPKSAIQFRVTSQQCYAAPMQWWPESLLKWFEIVTPVLAICAFVFGVLRYSRAEQARSTNLRIEAAKPFLERQLQLYWEATRCAAILAAPPDSEAAEQAHGRFLQLYLGELALVEDSSVDVAMRQFRDALENGATQRTLENLSLKLAHTCRDSLAKSWNTSAWQSHYTHPGRRDGGLDGES